MKVFGHPTLLLVLFLISMPTQIYPRATHIHTKNIHNALIKGGIHLGIGIGLGVSYAALVHLIRYWQHKRTGTSPESEQQPIIYYWYPQPVLLQESLSDTLALNLGFYTAFLLISQKTLKFEAFV